VTPTSPAPDWVADAIFYQVFPDRFARHSEAPANPYLEPWDAEPTHTGYKGGDLWGLIEKIDWIVELGCNALYLNPIFQSASNHRYHTHDYFTIDPLLGGDEAFNALLSACRERGIRVVLDGVFNHASRGFFQFNDLLETGESSPYRDWFHIHSFPLDAYGHDEAPASTYGAWWGIPALPKFRTETAEVREFLMRVGEHWVERGIDGWRLDVPEEIKTEGFWEEFRDRVRAKSPEAYLVGEIWGDASGWTVPGTRFDGTMNYLLTGAILSYVGAASIDWHLAERLHYPMEASDAGGFAERIRHLGDLYPLDTQKAHLNLLGSHDTARVLSILGGDTAALVLATLLQFTMPGAPSIYYGDELGLLGGHDPQCRAGFPWDNDEIWNHDLVATVRSLTALRAATPALRHGTVEVAGSNGGLIVIRRSLDGHDVLVAVNAGREAANVEIAQDAARSTTLWGTGGLSIADGAARIAMAPQTGAVWQVESEPA
jgi:neopullulanase